MAETSEPQRTEPDAAVLTTKQKIQRELKEWGQTLIIFVPIFMLFNGLLWEQRVIPSESMVPTLQAGDRIAVNKFAYGYSRYSLPFSLGRFVPLPKGRVFARQPKRGDVIVFEHTHYPRVMVKRLIGLPGDQIQVNGENLYVNGQPLEAELMRNIRYRTQKSPYEPNGVILEAEEIKESDGASSWLTYRTRDDRPRGLDDGDPRNTVLFVVPAGHYFFMGDNRDNSIDSRFLSGHCEPFEGVVSEAECPHRAPSDAAAPTGFVRFDHLIGRADTIILTVHRCRLEDGQTCPKRVWKGL